MKKTLTYIVFYLFCLGLVAALGNTKLVAQWFESDQRVLIALPN